MTTNKLVRSPELLSRRDSALLVIDVQERLLQLTLDYGRVLWNIERLLDGAGILGVHKLATEQNPDKLGPTSATLASRVSDVSSKMAFSCCSEGDLFRPLSERGIYKLVLVGIETHVCVLQTALDLISQGYSVYLVVDATTSRNQTDREVAMRRIESSGGTLVTTESVLFEWCERAGTDEFRQISALIRQPAPTPL